MFDWLAKIFGYVMKGCSWLTSNNYVLALLLFAFLMQVLLCPLSIKQQFDMIRRVKLSPKEMAIRKKYKGKTDEMSIRQAQSEIMALYQDAGISQFGGCLPMIFQLIIIFPIYQVVIRPLEFITGFAQETCEALYSALALGDNYAKDSISQIRIISALKQDPSRLNSFSAELQEAISGVGGIEELPNMVMFNTDLGMTPWDSFGTSFWWLVFIPVLNLGFTYLSQFLSKRFMYHNPRAEQMPNTSSMMVMTLALPLMTMFITFQFAAAIGIYWIFRTILSMIQQVILHFAMPYPVISDEEFKKAEAEIGLLEEKKEKEE